MGGKTPSKRPADTSKGAATATKKAKSSASTSSKDGLKQASISSFFAKKVEKTTPSKDNMQTTVSPAVATTPSNTNPATTSLNDDMQITQPPATITPPSSRPVEESNDPDSAAMHVENSDEEDVKLEPKRSRPRRMIVDEESDEDEEFSSASNTPIINLKSFSRNADSTVQEARPQSQEVRDRFVNLFGLGKSLDERGANNEGEDDEAPRKAQKGSKSSNIKYTPLEIQYLQIKKKHPDCMLIVEVGYKYKFFDEDALVGQREEIAAKELNIVAYVDKNMHAASIPVHRLSVHVKKLVQLGYKVGVVKQMETAAVKAAGDNKSAPFQRKLTNIYTRGTYIDDLDDMDGGSTRAESTYIMCIYEDAVDKSEKSTFSIVAIQLSTGDIIYDSFQDGFLRTELETRLRHIQPTEILVPNQSLSQPTQKMLDNWTLGSPDMIRVEKFKYDIKDPSTARTQLTDFYEKSIKAGVGCLADHYEKVLNLRGSITLCLAAMMHYLLEFGLEKALVLTKSFEPFASVGSMILSATTLDQLEVFQSTDYTSEKKVGAKGSLLWVIDHTATKGGSRLLQKWLARPLINISDLQKRIDAVENLKEAVSSQNGPIMQLKVLMSSLPDMERSLARIHFGRCTPLELYNALSALEKIGLMFKSLQGVGFRSEYLRELVAIPADFFSDTQSFLAELNHEAAKSGDKANLFVDEDRFSDIQKIKYELKRIDESFKEILAEVRTVLQSKSIDWVTVAGEEYLIEVKQSMVGKVPKSWTKVSNTKSVARFRTKDVIETMQEREYHKEKLADAAKNAFLEFQRTVANKYDTYREVAHSLAAIDCLLSLAHVASLPGYVKPSLCDESMVEVTNGRHAIIDALIDNYVPNDMQLNGSYVPADEAKIGIFHSIHTRMGASDDISRGQSTFMKELQETSDILKYANERALVILDELGRGTSTHDGTAIAFATLQYLLENVRCCTLFVTHYPTLGTLQDRFTDCLKCAHMGFLEHESEHGGPSSITFLYKLTDGLAHRSYGLNVARLATLPEDVITTAQVKSAWLENLKKKSMMRTSFQKLWHAAKPDDLPL
ncbi:Mismatch repair protein msh3 [Chytridiales sp. JEL 0842]|nr:Mismatch repair protein msh3 [Chytridiales sp. JEL 0842]